ncbi:hypothetical protein V6N12_074977 [Hibiscus sabdariffa]|uniref:Leucine-rich repeat-containing N-terminal plant-type domain-containing protein n=1 Tax=Hibiscus sabdariffa TaxID=183260 RepID=A0ABR2BZ86_9ROSI
MVDERGEWNWSRLWGLLPMETLERLAACPPPRSHYGDDVPGWRWDDNRKFTALAWRGEYIFRFGASYYGSCVVVGFWMRTSWSGKGYLKRDAGFVDWNEDDVMLCNWSGISCKNMSSFPFPRVTGNIVFKKNLRGYILPELRNLIYLRRLNLHNNNFYDSIPDQLFNATPLHNMFMYGNNL